MANEKLTKLLNDIENFEKIIKKLNSIQVKLLSHKSIAKNIVENYFRNCRNEIVVISNLKENDLYELDNLMQNLLDISQIAGSKSTYLKLLKSIRKSLLVLEKNLLLNIATFPQNDPLDLKIISTIKALIPSAALSYEQALLDLQSNSRLSWRGPATDLRESLREVLDHLAPDLEITSDPKFKLDTNAKGPTMKQKVRFILKQRQTNSSIISTTEESLTLIEESIGSYVRSVYTRASVSTHTPTDKQEVISVKEHVKLVLKELLAL